MKSQLNTTPTTTTTRSFSSSTIVLTPELIPVLQQDFTKPNDWAHSVLTQGLHVPSDIAIKLLKKELPWSIEGNRLQVTT